MNAPKVAEAIVPSVLNASVVRSLAWLAFFVYLLFWSPQLDADAILGCAAFIVAVAIHGLMCEARRGIRELMSLLNVIWLGLLIYALPIYVLSALTDISVLLDIDPKALTHAAWLTFISIAVTGFTVELLRPWAVSLHRGALLRLAVVSEERQFHAASVLLIVYGANYLGTGVMDLISSGNRFEITQAFETGKMWFIQYLMIGVTIAFIYQYFQIPTVRRVSFYLGLASVGLFWAMYLSLGNRRGVITVVLAAVACFVARNTNGKRAVATLLLAFAVAGLIGILRQDASAVAPDQAFLVGLSNFLGEFIYPGFTLVHTVELGQPATFEFTWLSLFYDFIAAQLQGQSFTFQAHRFAFEAAAPGGEIMGFAYLPITEAFQSFGAVAAAVSGVALLTSVLFLAWVFRSEVWIYLILLSLTLDINRSEFAAMVIQFSMITGGFLLTTKMRLR